MKIVRGRFSLDPSSGAEVDSLGSFWHTTPFSFNSNSSMKKSFILLLVVSFLVLPFSAQAGWRDLPECKILSTTAAVNGQATVQFRVSPFAGRKVKAYARTAYKSNQDARHPYGWVMKDQSEIMVLDAMGAGTFHLKNLRKGEKYQVSVSARQLEPHVEHSQASKYRKVRNSR